ncbi:UNVERIFIED_CONTAM: hypothetical protein K2H54_047329 [Gekko kuhli]
MEEAHPGGGWGELHPLQDTLWRSRLERRLGEQTGVIHPLQREKREASLRQSWVEEAALLEPPQGEEEKWCSNQQARHAATEPPGGNFQDTGQGWCGQGELSRLRGHECPVEDLLQHRCQVLKDQLYCYEEETRGLELSQRRERERHRQEQLAQAKGSVSLLQSMLDVYQKKYQASLCRAGELESLLAEGLAGQAQAQAQQRSLQEELRSRCRQLARAEDTIARLVQELRGAQEEQAQERQQHKETTRDLQERLAASQAKEEQAAENRVLREQLKQQAAQLEADRGNLKHLQVKLQQQVAEGLQQEATLSQLHTELRAAQDRERQSSQTLAAAEDLAQDLQRQVASCQASQREAMVQLEERGREVFRLHADLQHSQHQEAHLAEELAAYGEQVQQLRSQFQALQRQREEEASERLQGEVRHWRDKHHAAEQALADREEELVVLKVELVTLEEKWQTAAEEVKTLEGERAVAQRLLLESELMEANISQWVKEQKQVNEKLGHKIRDQIKQIARLTGERERYRKQAILIGGWQLSINESRSPFLHSHLQGLTERLQQEKKWLQNEVDELRVEQERFKALHSKAWDPRARQRLPWPGKNPPQCPCQSPSRALPSKWDRP